MTVPPPSAITMLSLALTPFHAHRAAGRRGGQAPPQEGGKRGNSSRGGKRGGPCHHGCVECGVVGAFGWHWPGRDRYHRIMHFSFHRPWTEGSAARSSHPPHPIPHTTTHHAHRVVPAAGRRPRPRASTLVRASSSDVGGRPPPFMHAQQPINTKRPHSNPYRYISGVGGGWAAQGQAASEEGKQYLKEVERRDREMVRAWATAT